MKLKNHISIFLGALMPMLSVAQVSDKYVESDVVRLDDKKGISLQTKVGDFLLKPYVLVQTAANFNYYDDEGLNLADQDKIANIGFSIPYACIGFSGKAFEKLTFNIVLNAAKSGGSLLQQAWFDVNIHDAFRIRAGKFKVPYNQAYLMTLGETMFPSMPLSLTTTANVNMSLNAAPPTHGLGFDLGLQLHGLVHDKFLYQAGVFNGTGIGTNNATKTMSDDHKALASLLYAGRVAFMPLGSMPSHQGSPTDLENNKLLFAASANCNVEAEDETSNDFRTGVEASWLYKRLFLSGEFYLLNMNWTSVMQGVKDFNMIGGYAQMGYFVLPKLQVAVRYDWLNRNGMNRDGYLNDFSGGINYFFVNYHLKLQAMYQRLGKYGHETQLDRDNDDTGLSTHMAMVLIQYSF